jgi:hypothetical protein
MSCSEPKVHSADVNRQHRSGFVLPFVIVAISIVAILGLATIGSTWRGFRAARLGANGVRAQYAADEGLARQLDAWPDDSLTAQGLGVTRDREWRTEVGDHVMVRTTRTHPLVAVMTADVVLNGLGTPGRVQRRVTRVVGLAPPDLPISGALTALTTVTGRDGSVVTGSDHSIGGDACGPLHEVAPVSDVVAYGLEADASHDWPAQPAWHVFPDSVAVRRQFERAWVTLSARSRVQRNESAAVRIVALPGWHSLLLSGASTTMQGGSRWRGLLSVAGDLIITGRVEVEGVLVVRGALDARGGELRVRGAVLVAPVGPGTAQLGRSTQLQYNRCAQQMGLATVSEATSRPFALWYSPLD